MSGTRAFLTVIGAVVLWVSTVSLANAQTENDMTVERFLEAASRNDADSLRRFLDGGTPVDSRDGNGRTALLIATRANAVAAAQALIAAGADVNAKDDIQDTPFLYAGAEGRLEILRMTVGAGANLADTNRYGGTALIPAAHHGHPDTVAYLLTTDIDIDHVNHLGWTALLEAVILGDGGPVYQDIVRQLLEVGADRQIADNDGRTPLDHARTRGQRAVEALLRDVRSDGR